MECYPSLRLYPLHWEQRSQGKMVVIVLAMHRTGSSLVANLLHNAFGVHMGDRFLGPGPWNPWGVWEDIEFVGMNKRLLCKAYGIPKGDPWREPPSPEKMEKAGESLSDRIAQLIQRKSKRAVWGWKDPRTCLTIQAYGPHLDPKDTIFIRTQRSEGAIVESLRKRGPSRTSHREWQKLARRYEQDAENFLREFNAQRVVRVEFEKLTSRQLSGDQVRKISKALSIKPDWKKVPGIIHHRT